MGSTPFLRLAMKKLLPLWICVFIGILSFPVSGHPESNYHSDTGLHADTYAFINGQWFNGEKFIPKTMYSKNGMFTHSTPEQIVITFDLKKGFVVPPFGEAHP